MLLRAPLYLLALIAVLIAFSGKTAQSQQAWRPGPTSAEGRYLQFGRQEEPIGATTNQAPLAATDTLSSTVYLPLIMRILPPPIDLRIDGLEITQSVQTPSNSVPLVTGRPTIVRVYARYIGTPAPSNITVSLTGTRDGVELPPVTLGPRSVSSAPSRGTYSSSFNLLLPAEWLSGTVALTAKVDSEHALDESDETNNTATATLIFDDVPALDLMIVPVRYTDIPSGITYPPPTDDTVSDFIRRTFPLSDIHVTFHAPIDFAGDLTDPRDWGDNDLNPNNDLLGKIIFLRQSEDPPAARIYYGLVPSGDLSNTWLPFSGGFILGIGLIGVPVSAGLDLSPDLGLPDGLTSETAAHELGHNLGRLHAPCGANANLDPDYPAGNASIVQFGVDVSKGTVLNPSTTKDVMSYCEPQWISDYTYSALYGALRATGLAAAEAVSQPSLFVRAAFGPGGAATLAPVYALEGTPDPAPASSDYRVEFLDAAGNILASQPVAASEIEQPHIFSRSQGRLVRQESVLAARGMETRPPLRAINAVVARPAQPFASLRLVHAGTVVATRAVSRPAPAVAGTSPTAARQADGTLLLRWGNPQAPALVRYTADGGASWTTLGIDLLGGALSVDPATLPGGGIVAEGKAGRFEIIPADSTTPAARVAVP